MFVSTSLLTFNFAYAFFFIVQASRYFCPLLFPLPFPHILLLFFIYPNLFTVFFYHILSPNNYIYFNPNYKVIDFIAYCTLFLPFSSPGSFGHIILSFNSFNVYFYIWFGGLVWYCCYSVFFFFSFLSGIGD